MPGPAAQKTKKTPAPVGAALVLKTGACPAIRATSNFVTSLL